MKRILIPTDFSTNARSALDYAIELFSGSSAVFYLYHAYKLPHAGAAMLISIQDLLKQEAEESLKKEILLLEEKYEDKIPDIQASCEMGDTFDCINGFVDRNNIDFIVMGTKGASGWSEKFLGSNTAVVIRTAKCPVLAIPLNITLKIPKKIVFAVDEISLMAGNFPKALVWISKKFNAKVMLLNIIKEGQYSKTGVDVEDIPAMEDFDNVEYSLHFDGNVDEADGIEKFAEKHQADIIAMIPRHTQFLERLFHKSVTKKMAFHTNIPLLAMPEIKS